MLSLVLIMPKRKATTEAVTGAKKKAVSLKRQIVRELKSKHQALKKDIRKVVRDLKSFGVRTAKKSFREFTKNIVPFALRTLT